MLSDIVDEPFIDNFPSDPRLTFVIFAPLYRCLLPKYDFVRTGIRSQDFVLEPLLVLGSFWGTFLNFSNHESDFIVTLFFHEGDFLQDMRRLVELVG